MTKKSQSDHLEKSLNRLHQSGADGLLTQFSRGIEKECLRTTADGRLAMTRHPNALGSALTNRFVTTDYSESLLEFVTPVCKSMPDMLSFLEQLHLFTVNNIGEERLWAASMPCLLDPLTEIPIAEYGSSHPGMMKHIYRRGLKHRYGDTIQAIAGIHYNLSLAEEFWPLWLDCADTHPAFQDRKSEEYFHMLRNFHRHCWFMFYISGASPTICESFIHGRDHGLNQIDEDYLNLPYATCLRMSKVGYRNDHQSVIRVNSNSVHEYIGSLRRATQISIPQYRDIGVKVNGEYRQLNSNLLQIENEYYDVIRAKTIARSGEKPTRALAERGVEYLEIRCLDLDPFSPIGVDENVLHCIDVLLVYSLLSESTPLYDAEAEEIFENRNMIMTSGRDPDAKIQLQGESQSVEAAGVALCDALLAIAAEMDSDTSDGCYTNAVRNQQEKFTDSNQTPSARIRQGMKENGEGFFSLAHRLTEDHGQALKKLQVIKHMQEMLIAEAQLSHQRQAEMEKASSGDFDAYLAQYFAESLHQN